MSSREAIFRFYAGVHLVSGVHLVEGSGRHEPFFFRLGSPPFPYSPLPYFSLISASLARYHRRAPSRRAALHDHLQG